MGETPSFSNGNGNGADEDQSKDMEDGAPQEPKSEPFDVFGKMLSSMPAKPADEEGGVKLKMRTVTRKRIPLTKCSTRPNHQTKMKRKKTTKTLNPIWKIPQKMTMPKIKRRLDPKMLLPLPPLQETWMTSTTKTL